MAHTNPDLIDFPLFQQIRDTNFHHLYQIVFYIENIICFNESKSEHRLVVTHEVNCEVAELPDFLAGINPMLAEVGKSQCATWLARNRLRRAIDDGILVRKQHWLSNIGREVGCEYL